MAPPRKNMTTGLSKPPGRVGLVEAKLPVPPPPVDEVAVAVEEVRAFRRETAPKAVKKMHPMVAAVCAYAPELPEDEVRRLFGHMADTARYSTAMPPVLAEVLIRIAAEIEEEG